MFVLDWKYGPCWLQIFFISYCSSCDKSLKKKETLFNGENFLFVIFTFLLSIRHWKVISTFQ